MTNAAPLGQPPSERDDPDQPTDAPSDPDFAGEHEDTAVDKRITSGTDDDSEPESPAGWSGLEPDKGIRAT
jgi:hypothetical protein